MIDQFMIQAGVVKQPTPDDVTDEVFAEMVEQASMALIAGVQITYTDWLGMSPATQAAFAEAGASLRGYDAVEKLQETAALKQEAAALQKLAGEPLP